ncbi:MAG: hypothetical protein JRI95_16030 [Deltaproteobacteria bacterium]|nr:hypothetical protein [Deltaproteobacteria bacterium]
MSRKFYQKVALLVLVLVFGLCSTAWAADYYVDATNGNDGYDGLSWGVAKATFSPVYSAVAVSTFPIAVTAASEMALSAAFDGTNYLVGIQGDPAAHYNITAQLVSRSGSLVGSRISIGRTGGVPLVAFDGTNYLMVWTDDATHPNDDIYGRFISPSGTLVGAPFPISTAAGNQEITGIAFDGTNYLVVWKDGRYSAGEDIGPWYVYGQLVSNSGSLVGGEIQISSAPGSNMALAFDGTNYLVVFNEDTNDTDIYGQFISPARDLVGSSFVIDSNSYPSDNPTNVVFDGTKYLVTFHDEINGEWDIYGRFVSTSGSVGSRLPISNAAGNQHFPQVSFDGTDYLVTMTEGFGGSSLTRKGRLYDINFNPVGDWFIIAETVGGKVPLGPFFFFDGSRYFGVLTNAALVLVEDMDTFTEGDVYGVFLGSASTYSVTLPPGTTVADYRILALPLMPDELDPATLIGSQIGTYDTNLVRIAAYDSDNQEFAEYPFSENISDAEPGSAAWFLFRHGQTLTFEGTETPVVEGPMGESGYFMELAPGWNLIGNPFNFEISVESILIKQGSTVVYLTHGNNQITQSVFWVWSNGDYVPALTLPAGTGGWLLNLTPYPGQVFFTALPVTRSTTRQTRVEQDGLEKPPAPPRSFSSSFSPSADSGSGGCFISTIADK